MVTYYSANGTNKRPHLWSSWSFCLTERSICVRPKPEPWSKSSESRCLAFPLSAVCPFIFPRNWPTNQDKMRVSLCCGNHRGAWWFTEKQSLFTFSPGLCLSDCLSHAVSVSTVSWLSILRFLICAGNKKPGETWPSVDKRLLKNSHIMCLDFVFSM